MLSVKQGGIKSHFSSLWYDSTWDWNPVSWAIDEKKCIIHCIIIFTKRAEKVSVTKMIMA